MRPPAVSRLVVFYLFVFLGAPFLTGGLEPARPAPGPSRADLSPQFDPEFRDQGERTTCHVFAATALLEAAYFRAAHRRIRLSEADLFARVLDARPRILRGIDNGLMLSDLRVALRENIRPELSGVRAGSYGFGRFFSSAARTVITGRAPASCSAGERRDFLMRRLDGGQPVGVGVFGTAVSNPDMAAHGGALRGSHYVVVTGYENTGGGTIFHIRNSHGRRPDAYATLNERDLCALFSMVWLSAPGEPD